jgi:hypothetical protein
MRLSLLDWLKENFGLVATFLGFTIDSITLIALINSKVTPSIPFIDYPLGEMAQMMIWGIASVTYLGFLRGYWLQLREKCVSESAQTFIGFLIRDIILLFKHPFLLLPIIVLVGILYFMLPNLWSFRSMIFAALVFFVVILPFSTSVENSQANQDWRKVLERPKTDDINLYFVNRKIANGGVLSTQWVQRIDEELNRMNYIADHDLSRMYSCSRSVARKVLRTYLKEYGSAKSLILVEQEIQLVRNSSHSIQVVILAPRAALDSKPWSEKYELMK